MTFARHLRSLCLAGSLALALPACQRAAYRSIARLAPATSHPVGKALPDDPAAAALIRPYHDKVASQMAEVVGTAPAPLVKSAGESPLANFVADIQRARASQALNEPIALSVMTNGGLRAALPAGPITLGAVFELMPFENELVVLDVPGPVVRQLFDYAARSKMAVAGATYAVTFDGQPQDIRIGGQPFDPNQARTWPIAISDYLASGGDNMLFFKSLPPRHTNILLRAAIADHIRALTKAGKPVEAKVEGRVRVN
ncbi:5'-nucleotidase C-terminal domain-containing protein [uncultured Hymenobacter sp.]|uniref:5'-nucleotidase C-terminal domain-containing protein n=1 Tax=uncultured Hymenobacter sp. TaxID=170016 RepID=UPI0035C97DA6